MLLEILAYVQKIVSAYLYVLQEQQIQKQVRLMLLNVLMDADYVLMLAHPAQFL